MGRSAQVITALGEHMNEIELLTRQIMEDCVTIRRVVIVTYMVVIAILIGEAIILSKIP